MKTLGALVTSSLHSRQQRTNFRVLVNLLLLLTLIVGTYTVAFHLIMAREGQDHSWLSGFYWTMVTMSTLGYGDVSFHSDLGRMFSVLVVMSGTVFMLILLPFTFIQFFYAPWLEARNAARAPKALPAGTRDHVLLTQYGAIDAALIRRLDQFNTPYAVIVQDLTEALALHDQGITVMVGDLDDPETYRAAHADQAALVATTRTDVTNTNVAFTVREIAAHVPIVATASSPASVDNLQLAGCQQVLQLGNLLGKFLARRVTGRDRRAHVIGELDTLLIAEASVAGTPLVGQTLRDARLRDRFRLNVAGVWERGAFEVGLPDTTLADTSVLFLAGPREALAAYDAEYGAVDPGKAFVLILGGGRVGRATAEHLAATGIDYCLVEKLADRASTLPHTVVGDAAEIDILKAAGLDRATTVAVTTHDDDMNVYLTLYCRRLKPDLQILSRATLDRNVSTLYRAGADIVLSYASMGANAIFNLLRRRDLVLLGEGLDVFQVTTPKALVGRTLAQAGIRESSRCNVLAILRNGKTIASPSAHEVLEAGGDLILIGDHRGEESFFRNYRD
ncbi:MAG: potassium channel protein [Acidimicrobiia bacterium]|nr:potassium channel protein [Acidimicrobiia bacterium]